jgi:hypothetical protein
MGKLDRAAAIFFGCVFFDFTTAFFLAVIGFLLPVVNGQLLTTNSCSLSLHWQRIAFAK